MPLMTTRMHARRTARLVQQPMVAAVSDQLFNFASSCQAYLQRWPSLQVAPAHPHRRPDHHHCLEAALRDATGRPAAAVDLCSSWQLLYQTRLSALPAPVRPTCSASPGSVWPLLTLTGTPASTSTAPVWTAAWQPVRMQRRPSQVRQAVAELCPVLV